MLTFLAALWLAPLTSGTDVTWRSYDLSALVQERGFRSDVLSLLPYRSGFSDAESDDDEARLIEPDDLVDWIAGFVAPDLWEHEEYFLGTTGPEQTRLVVRAPATMHQQIENVLRWLFSTAVSQQSLEVRVLCASGGSAGPGPLVLEPRVADQRGAELARSWGSPWQRLGSLRLRDGLASRVEAGRIENVVLDWEHEVAQAAVAGDPEPEVVQTGTTLVVRPYPEDGGTLLEVMLRHSRPVSPTAARDLRARGELLAQNGTIPVQVVGDVHHPILHFASVAGSLWVPDQKALWLPAEIRTAAGSMVCLFDLRVRGQARSLRPRLAHDVQQQTYLLAIRSLGARLSSGLHLPGIPNYLFDPVPRWTDEYTCVASLRSGFEGSFHQDFLEEVVRSALGDALDAEPNRLHFHDGRMLSLLPDALLRAANEAIDHVAPWEPPRTLTVTVRSRDEPLGRFSSPILPGRPVTLWSGLQGTQIVDWEVDVANNARSASPEVQAWVDGMALRVRQDPAPDGSLRVEIQGMVHLLDELPRPLELGVPLTPELDQCRVRVLHVNETRFTRPGETVELHGAGLTLTVALD